MEDVDRDVYFEDVKLQLDAKMWGEEYNRHNPPKKVGSVLYNFCLNYCEIVRFLPLTVTQVTDPLQNITISVTLPTGYSFRYRGSV